jgi:hypothetical protein
MGDKSPSLILDSKYLAGNMNEDFRFDLVNANFKENGFNSSQGGDDEITPNSSQGILMSHSGAILKDQ